MNNQIYSGKKATPKVEVAFRSCNRQINSGAHALVDGAFGATLVLVVLVERGHERFGGQQQASDATCVG